jgi:arabinofuranosyltransferase
MGARGWAAGGHLPEPAGLYRARWRPRNRPVRAPGAGCECGVYRGDASREGEKRRRAEEEKSRRGEEQKRRSWAIAAGLLFSLATLTRPEGALLLALTLLHSFVSVQRSAFILQPSSFSLQPSAFSLQPSAFSLHPSAFILLPFLAVVLPFFAWRLAYYGDPLPNTFYVKTGGGPDTWLRGLAYLGSFARDFGGPLLLFALTAPFLPRRHEDSKADTSSRLRVFVVTVLGRWPGYLLMLCAAYAAYVVAVGGDHFPGHRFLVPLVPWLALLIAAGMAHSYALLIRYAPGRHVAPVVLAVLLVLYSGYALGRSQRYDTVLAGNDESLWLWAEIGWWLHDNAAPDESAAALGAGAIAFYSERTVIDLLGLTERHIARVPPAPGAAVGHEKRDPEYVLNVRRPTYIPRIWDDYFGGAGALRERYELITVHTRYGREIELWRLNNGEHEGTLSAGRPGGPQALRETPI